MAVMFCSLNVPGNVGKKVEIFCVLTSTEYVSDIMITDDFLKQKQNNLLQH